MTNDFYKVLQECIAQARSGVSLEHCLSLYPQYADELRRLLTAATASQSQLSPGMPSATRHRLRSRVMGHWDAKHSRRRTWSFPSFLPVRWAGAAAALVVFLAIAGGAGTVAASQKALPGSVLYPVKEFREDAGLWFTSSPEEKVNVYSRYAQERAREIQELAQRGDSADMSTSLSRLEQHLSAVDRLTEASTTSPETESSRDSMVQTLEGTLASTSQSNSVQEALAQSDDASAYPCVEYTLQILRQARGRVDDAVKKVGGSLTDDVGLQSAEIGRFCPH